MPCDRANYTPLQRFAICGSLDSGARRGNVATVAEAAALRGAMSTTPSRLAVAVTTSLLASLAHARPAAAAEPEAAPPSATAHTNVAISSDWEETAVLRHLGTSYGVGTVGGRTASVTTVHLERVCRAPCSAKLETEGSYIVDAPGMNPARFELPAGVQRVDVRVKGASQTPLTLSYVGAVTGGVLALTGGLLWGVLGSGTDAVTGQPRDAGPWPMLTIGGASLLVAGIAGLVALPRTRVESGEGARLDASTKKGPHLTAEGVAF